MKFAVHVGFNSKASSNISLTKDTSSKLLNHVKPPDTNGLKPR